jgi:trans-2,3-dihydro-3-hydroxyanthranilate isomerase
MSTLAYEIVDVFTERPFTGNPLAVVYGADALAADQMQALAREFHLSETVFLLPSQVATYRARIFTPEAELPFAGHPSIGAAVAGVRRGLFPAGDVTQECGAGVLPLRVAGHHATLAGGPVTVGDPVPAAGLMAAVGLAAEPLAPPRSAGCGLDFHYLPVRPQEVAAARAPSSGTTMLSVFAWDAATATAHARVFCPGVAVPEDPATGSAALGLGVYLVALGLLPGDRTSAYTVRQGAELRRPSVLECTVTAESGRATAATVAGHVTPVAAGEIAVPPFVG